MLEKTSVCSRGHIFSPIIMKYDQYVCLEILHKFENRSCPVKNRLQVKSLKNLVYRRHFQSDNHEILSEFFLDEISDEFENGSSWEKN